MNDDLALRYWKAVADLPVDRRRALGELEACFAGGAHPQAPSGRLEGRLLSTTFGHGLDGAFMLLARLWMPWKGKSLDAEAKGGRNLFTRGLRAPMRLLWPSYGDVRDEGAGLLSAFRFTTWDGSSAILPDTQVLKIDYDHEGSPTLAIRPILDELVQIDEGLYLGQALMRRGGEFHRVAWFSLAG